MADEVLDVFPVVHNTGIDAKVLFAKFDSDSDGSIDSEELKEGLLKLNLADLPPSQIDRLIMKLMMTMMESLASKNWLPQLMEMNCWTNHLPQICKGVFRKMLLKE